MAVNRTVRQIAPMRCSTEQFKTVLIGLCLTAVTVLLYFPVRNHDFINFDDEAYLLNNANVQRGITWQSMAWAFTAADCGNWHPITWLSHMLDCRLLGLNPGWHHLVNAFFHAANSALLFLLLKSMTGAIGRSAIVAALFAWHPLHVESVAWASERKDTLSALFFILTLWAYLRFTRLKVQGPSFTVQCRRWYGLALLLFTLGLMSKPMLVTLPFVLLLLDFWPLRRWQPSAHNSQPASLRRLLWEKVPFFLLSAALSLLTLLVQSRGGAVAPLAELPIGFRLANALRSYATYLRRLFWPHDLAVFYPYPNSFSMSQVLGATLLLLVLTVLALRFWRRKPYAVVGWLWYLGTLVPVIGLVHVGDQALADRYTYLPLIGVLIVLAWGATDLVARWRPARRALLFPVALILAGCLALTSRQIGYWRTSESLFARSVAVNPDNYMAHCNLGRAFEEQGRVSEAMAHLHAALRIMPSFPPAHNALGAILARQGKPDEALAHFATALRFAPDDADTHNNLGSLLEEQGQFEEAIAHFRAALRCRPQFAEAHYNLGRALFDQGRYEQAIEQCQLALRLKPGYGEAWNNLGVSFLQTGKPGQAAHAFAEALRLNSAHTDARHNLAAAFASLGKVDEAIKTFREVLQARPEDAEAHWNLGLLLSRQGHFAGAITEYQEALRIEPGAVATHLSLAEAYAGVGQFADAARQVQQAMALAREAGDTNGAAQMETRLKRYQASQPYREP